MTPKPAPVAIYLRISKAEASSTSIDKQRANCRRYAVERFPGAEIVEFVDEGKSATKAAVRPAFAALQASLSRFQAVVFDKQDRIARKPLDFWIFAAKAEEAGTVVHGASEPLDLATADGELTAGVRLALARAEARRTSERVRATNAHRRSKGLRSLGGPATFGLTRHRDGFRPDPERAPLVVEAVERVLSGAGVRTIAESWTAQGIPTARGGATWSDRAVAKILRSPAIAGMTPANGDVLRGDDGMPLVYQEAALVDLETWHALQAALDNRSPGPAPKRRETRTLLHGLAFDPEGHPLYFHSGRASYTCRKIGCQTKTSIRLQALDSYVSTEFLDAYGLLPETTTEGPGADPDPAALSSIRAEISKTLASLANPAADVVTLATRLQALRENEARLLVDSATSGLRVLRHTGRTLREAWDQDQDPDSRRALLAGWIDRVIVSPATRAARWTPIEDRVSISWADEVDSESV